jgi:hypothetical protein
MLEAGVRYVKLVWVDLCNVPRAHMVQLQKLTNAHDSAAHSIAHEVAKGVLCLSPYHTIHHTRHVIRYNGPAVNPVGKLQLEPVLRMCCQHTQFDDQVASASANRDAMQDDGPLVPCYLRMSGGMPWALCPMTFLERQVTHARHIKMPCRQ